MPRIIRASGASSVLRAVAGLLRTWWRVDRIRASPGEARLLRLQPPCVTIIDGEPVEFLNRQTVDSPEGPRVLYHCRRLGRPDRLLVIPGCADSESTSRWLGAP